MPESEGLSRRTLLRGTAGLGLATLGCQGLAQQSGATPPPPTAAPQGKKAGWAILGLGGYALGQIMPNFKECQRSRLVAVISGSPDKAKKVAGDYGLDAKNVYSYENLEAIKDNPDIDVVYVITPPGNHREFTVRSAQAGKHVCCEKPMAPTAKDCQAMIDACRKAGKLLQIGYRSRYEPHNIRAIEACRKGELGRLRSIVSDHGFNIPNGLWRTQRKLSGGGSMMDIGIYSLNAARYLAGEEPVEVYATIHNLPNDPRFKEVEDTVHFTLRFPSGVVANCSSGYSWAGMNRYHVIGERGTLEAEPATSYGGQRLTMRRRPVEVPPGNQFAAQMDHLSACILDGGQVLTPGEDGLQDIRIIEAIYESARIGRPVKL
jgi:predicted dehydrogenase